MNRLAPPRFVGIATIAGLLAAVAADRSVAEPPGKALADVQLQTTTLAALDKPSTTLDKLRGRAATVVAFYSTECPISNAYVPTLNKLAAEFAGKGVSLVWVNPNDGQSIAKMELHRREYAIPGVVWKDAGGAAAKGLGATMCPTVCVIDEAGKLCYRGRIDDRYYRRGGAPREVSSADLRDAIEAVLRGAPVGRPTTDVVGCPVVFASAKSAALQSSAKTTWARDVAPILQKHCQDCHREGGVGPFALTTFDEAKAWAEDVKTFTADGTMPPWKPVDGVGDFHGRRGLSAEEKTIIAEWVREGAQAGDLAQQPPPRVFPETWTRGVPDLILDPGAEFEISADGHDVYRNFVFRPSVDHDLYATAYEVLPGNRRVVHHVLLFSDSSGRAQHLDDRDPGPGYDSSAAFSVGLPGFVPDVMLGGWSPGNSPHALSHGAVFRIPRGSSVVMQVHYSKTGKVERDRTRVGLFLSKEPPKRAFGVLPIEPLSGRIGTFLIPPGAKRYESRCSNTLPQDVLVLNVTPHMHLLGTEMQATAVLPNGTKIPLIHVKNWDFHWQETYFFREPIVLPKGTRLDMVAYFDNSEDNPNNPHRPPRAVRYGEQTYDEMCICFLGGCPVKEAESPGELRAPGLDQLFVSEIDRIRNAILPRGR